METHFGIYKKILVKELAQGGPHPIHEGGGTPLGRAPYLVVPLELHRPQFQLHIFTFGEKKIREKDSLRFTIRSRRQDLNSLRRADLESVRGSGRGESVAIVIINLPPSPIS